MQNFITSFLLCSQTLLFSISLTCSQLQKTQKIHLFSLSSISVMGNASKPPSMAPFLIFSNSSLLKWYTKPAPMESPRTLIAVRKLKKVIIRAWNSALWNRTFKSAIDSGTFECTAKSYRRNLDPYRRKTFELE